MIGCAAKGAVARDAGRDEDDDDRARAEEACGGRFISAAGAVFKYVDDADEEEEEVIAEDAEAGGSKFSAFTVLKVFEWSSLCLSELPSSSPKQRNARLRASVTAAFFARSIA